jgi:hypothetical protein
MLLLVLMASNRSIDPPPLDDKKTCPYLTPSQASLLFVTKPVAPRSPGMTYRNFERVAQ